MRELHIPAEGHRDLLLTPDDCDWSYTGLIAMQLSPGESRSFNSEGNELAVLPLEGGCTVEAGSTSYTLEGRDSVFDRVTDFAYVGLDTDVRISSTHGGWFALPTARAGRKIDHYYGDARAVSVELRGAASCTRQLNNFLGPGEFDADRLTAVEVLTPRGNWSSYPPHKHDVAVPGGEAELEEIYFFIVSGGDAGYGAHRTYDLAQGWDTTVTVRSGDVFLVPRGYHGPCMAAPDYDMYYLNVLAGPGAERTLAFSDDPSQLGVRDTWAQLQPDPRVPLTSADGRRVEAMTGATSHGR